MKKILVLLLAAVMLFSVFACTKNEDKKPADTTSPVTTPGATTEPTTEVITTTEDPNSPYIDDITFEGADFRIAAREMYLVEEVFIEEVTTEPRALSIWERNAAVQDKYDVKITPVKSYDTTVGGHAKELVDFIMADEDVYDIGLTFAISSEQFVTKGLTINWNSLDYTDFTKDYWIESVNENLIIDDAIYTPVGDMCTTALTWTYAVFYNRTKGDQMYLDAEQTVTVTEEVFEKIDAGEWTIDYFMSLIGDMYQDLDSTIGRSEGDFYGFTAWTGNDVDMFPYAFNIPIISPDPDVVLKFTLGSEKGSTAVDKINQLYWQTNGSYCTDHPADTVQVHPLKFVRGEALFTTSWMRQCFELFADMDDQYSILPYPMFDENQDKYRTSAADRYSVITIPKTCKNLDMVSIVTEALNYESQKRVFPVYYEESLQKKYTHDIESIEMLDIIMDGRTFDISTILMYEISWEFRHAITAQRRDFKTYCDRQAAWKATVIGRVVEEYRNNKNLGIA